MNFEPNKVNIQKKNCRMEGKETVCINATVCFHVKLKSKEDAVYEAGEPTHTAGAGGQGAGGGQLWVRHKGFGQARGSPGQRSAQPGGPGNMWALKKPAKGTLKIWNRYST